MATKTMKIGLSTSDKSTMSATIQAAVLSIVAPTYSSSSLYAVGDLVYYDGGLYKCKTAITTAEAWTAAHWTATTFADEEKGKLSKGSYDGSTGVNYSDVADNFTPYSESSGASQNDPFLFEATGCGNGTAQVDTGSLMQLQEKRGNTVGANQLYSNYNFLIDAKYAIYESAYLSGSVSNNKLTITVLQDFSNGVYVIMQLEANTIVGHKYLYIAVVKSVVGNNTVRLSNYNNTFSEEILINQGETKTCFAIGDESAANPLALLRFVGPSVTGNQIEVHFYYVIDLNQWGFSASALSDLTAHPEHFFRYYQGSLAYDAGSLKTADGRYVKPIGRQAWNQEWEHGSYTGEPGEVATKDKSDDNTWLGIRCKDPIDVIPCASYFIGISSGANIYIQTLFIDDNGAIIAYADAAQNHYTFTVPANCKRILFRTNNGYGASYLGDIILSLYYNGESYLDESNKPIFFDYEELANVDTGTEILYSAGNAYDSKTPDGVITRRVMPNIDLATLTWTKNEYTVGGVAKVRWSAPAPTGVKSNLLDTGIANITCSTYTPATPNQTYSNTYDKIIAIDSVSNILVVDLSLTGNNKPSGILNAELAEYTTEQGTPFQKNIPVDDFGSIQISNTTGVPQGNLIFYPVDYKASLDTLLNALGGDGSNVTPLEGEGETLGANDPVTLKGEIDAREAGDAGLLATLGGTLRQVLCVKESLDFDNTNYVDLGTLTWNYRSNNGEMYAIGAPADAYHNDSGTVPKAICTKYKTSLRNVMANGTISIHYSDNIYITVKDLSYTDPTTFKAAMKGVLLAYEKASE